MRVALTFQFCCFALSLRALAEPLACETGTSRVHIPKDSSCLTDSIDLESARSIGSEITIVDIRPPSEYNRVHIEGALNIAPHIIKTKVYLKEKPILIVGEAHDLQNPLRLCDELKRSGFQHFQVLTGGIRRLAMATGFKVVGARESLEAPPLISAHTLLGELSSSAWLLVSPNPLPSPEQIAGIPVTALSGRPKQIVSELKVIRERSDEGSRLPQRIALLEHQTLFKTETQLALSREFRPGELFIISGGLPKLKEAAALEQKVFEKSSTPLEPRSCG